MNTTTISGPAPIATRWKYAKHRIKFGVLFAFIVGVAVMTPHIVHGHFLVPEEYSQSAIILLDVLVFLVILFFYRRETRKLMDEKRAGERLLSDSYRYIGKANRTMDIVSQFMDAPILPANRNEEKATLVRLSSILIVTILKAERGTLRFVNNSTERTVAEYSFCLSGGSFNAKIPNKELMTRKFFECLGNEITVVTTGLSSNAISCSLCFVEIEDIDADRKQLALALLNHLLLLFIISRYYRNDRASDAAENVGL